MATNPNAMADALARLWTRFLPEIELRVGLLEAASQALTQGSLSDEVRTSAHAAAHKLAGSLGTFGLHLGTDLARQSELLLAETPSAQDAAALADWVAELRAVITNHSS